MQEDGFICRRCEVELMAVELSDEQASIVDPIIMAFERKDFAQTEILTKFLEENFPDISGIESGIFVKCRTNIINKKPAFTRSGEWPLKENVEQNNSGSA